MSAPSTAPPPGAIPAPRRSWPRPPALRRLPSRVSLRPLVGYAFILPAVAILVLFFYVPAVLLFIISFLHFKLAGPGTGFAGLSNFEVLFNQPLFIKSLEVTGYYVLVMVPATIVLALALAMLVRDGIRRSRRRRGGIAQALIFLPHVTPLVATSLIWVYILNPQYGFLNFIVGQFTAHPPGWLFSSTWALPAVMIYSLWHSVGLYMVLLLAGLAIIPDRLIEAAQVDGVTGFACFRRVIWPQLRPTVYLVTLLATVATMQAFSQIYTLSGGAHGHGGGPAYATTTDSLLIYQTAFQYFHFSLAAAMSLMLFVILLIITIVQRWGFSSRQES